MRVVFLHDLPESYIAVKIKLAKNVRMYVTDFFFSAAFLNNKHVPHGNKTPEHLEKFCFSYCDNRPKSEILLWSVTLLL